MHFFPSSLNLHISLMVRAFDLILILRTRHTYQLSADIHSHKAVTKCAYKSPLSLVYQRYLIVSTNFGYAVGGQFSTTLKVVTRNAIKH